MCSCLLAVAVHFAQSVKLHMSYNGEECSLLDALDHMKLYKLLEAVASISDTDNGVVVPCVYLGAFKGIHKEQDFE
jgi:hypothetical protein